MPRICWAAPTRRRWWARRSSRRFDRQSADDVLDVIRRTMPQEAPDTLGMPAYADIVSYLFKSNGSPAGKTELPTDRAKLREILVTSK